MAKSSAHSRAQSAPSSYAASRKPKTTGLQSAKPYADFPLFAHTSGRWAKKIRGRMTYFGPIDNWQAALKLYEANKVALHAGSICQPRPLADYDEPTVYDLCKKFMDFKDVELDAGKIAPTTHRNYNTACRELIRAFGESRTLGSLGIDDFTQFYRALVKRLDLSSIDNLINRVRCIFNYAANAKLIAAPMDYGPEFRRPDKTAKRKAKRLKPSRMFTPEDLQRIIAASKPQMKAMVLLGLNGGLGPSDLGQMTTDVIDWELGMIVYPRPKTGAPRRFPMWPETVEALKAAIGERRKPRSRADADIVFVTVKGNRWHKDIDSSNPLSMQFKRLLEGLDLYRRGASFYSLRHCFETIAGRCRDKLAVDYCMGHLDPTIAADYRDEVEGMDDARLQAAVNCVHEWLFGAIPK